MTRRLVDIALLAGILAVVPFFVPNSYIFDVVIRIGLTAVAVIGLNILMGLAMQPLSPARLTRPQS
jgi:branched-chain amino acid transport system permease protein